MISNARYAIADGDGGEGGALIESSISDARNTIRDDNRGEGGAISESPLSNACNVVGNAIVGDAFRNANFAKVLIGVIMIISPVSYCYVVAVKKVVIDAIYYEIMCPEACGSKKCPEKKKKFSHNR